MQHPKGYTKPQLDQNRVARFFLVHDTKSGTNVPNEHKMYQMVIKYFNFSQSEALENLPKLGFWV
jgi:hypothetical protein